jgi:signal transduction histidine kinase/ActR/RegA family two-component response regulator
VAAFARITEEPGQLRRCLRDLLALNALPALWQHQPEHQIAESTADALISILRLEFVYISLALGAGDASTELVRVGYALPTPAIHDLRSSIARWLQPPLLSETVRMANPLASGSVQTVAVPIGLSGQEFLVAASKRTSFPNEIERLLLGVAANQAVLALQRRRAEQAALASEARYRELSENLEQRVAERTRELEAEKVERERAEAAFRQAQRMEAMGHLTGGVAHDFNNLLLIISGNLELLRKRSGGTGADRQLNAIEKATRRGESLTRHLLSFSRRQTLHPSTLYLTERLPELMELIRPSLRGDIDLRLEIESDIWPVRADPGELELALLNVAVNARDAMPGGGSLVVSAYNRPVGALDARGEVDAGDYVAISLRDSGEGIPADVLPRVFEPFFTTKDAGHGSGLGLSQVYGFARQSGGAALIDSQLGRGTTVTILLPRMINAAAPQFEAVRHRIDERIVGTVLLVDDNEEVAEITAALLEELGCRTKRARNAGEALEIFTNGGIDLVLSDIIMPGGMNGLDLARSLRERFPGLAILLTTGYSAAAQEAARDEFPILPKPYRRSQLAEAISNLLAARQWMENSERPDHG